MSKSKPIELFSLKALAAEEGISYSHMRKLMIEITKSDPVAWRGWSFQAIGQTWIAYRGKPGDVILHNEPKPELSPGTDGSP